MFHINFCFPSRIEIFLFRDSSFVWHLQKSCMHSFQLTDTSLTNCKLTQVCRVRKVTYLIIILQRQYIKGFNYFQSTYLSLTTNNSVIVIRANKVKSVTLRHMSAAKFTRCNQSKPCCIKAILTKPI